MCERYSFALPQDKTARRYGVKVPYPLEAHYNISPGTRASIICNRTPGLLSMAEWGVTGPPTKAGKPGKRISSIALSHLLKTEETESMLSRRCLVPADGFYVWRQVSRRSRVPYRIILKWNLPFAMAGIWTEEEGSSGVQTTFAILTTVSNELLLSFGVQMPVLLPLEEEKNWLSNENDIARLGHLSYPAGQMKIFPVSPQVNQREINSPALVEPVQAADQFGNYMLFE